MSTPTEEIKLRLDPSTRLRVSPMKMYSWFFFVYTYVHTS